MSKAPFESGWSVLYVALVMVVGGLTLGALANALPRFVNYPLNGIRVERLEADLNDRLPDGSAREQAEAWFASHGIQCWQVVDDGGRPVVLGATIPNDGLLESAEIRIQVSFGPDGRVCERLIDRFVYSS